MLSAQELTATTATAIGLKDSLDHDFSFSEVWARSYRDAVTPEPSLETLAL